MHRNNRTSGPGRIAVLLLLGLVLLAAPQQAAAQGGDGPAGAAFRGERLFTQRCVQCHGPQGRGDGSLAGQMPVAIADFTDPTFVETRSPQDLFNVIRDGRIENLMPPWVNEFDSGQLWDLVAYVWSLHLSAADLAAGAQAYAAACASCHGLDGSGAGQGLASLASPRWLASNEAELRAAVDASTHPAVEGLAAQERTLAVAMAREFSLGFAIASARVEGDGVIDVLVQNGTTGLLPVAHSVRLLIFAGDQFVSELQAETNAAGLARFTGLPTDPSWVFIAQTSYLDLPYATNLLQFTPPQASLETPLNVYETGATLADVRVSRAHWVINMESPHRLDVGELYAFVNSSDRVYLGEETGADGQPLVLLFSLPADATNVSFESGDQGARFIQLDGSVADTLPLPPGQRQILFRYSVPVTDGAAVLEHPISYGVDYLNLLVPDLGMTVEAPGWVQEAPLQMQQGAAFLNYTLANLSAGERPRAAFSGISAALFAAPAASANTTAGQQPRQVIDPLATPGISGQPFLPFLLAALALAVLGAGTLYALRRQHIQHATLPSLREQQRLILLQEIASLDQAFEAGDLTESTYQLERRQLKARLVTLLRSDGER